MNVSVFQGRIEFTKVDFFDSALSLDCGQTFRWTKTTQGAMHGIAYGRAVDILQDGDTLTVCGDVRPGDETVWLRYLDLETPYREICGRFLSDTAMKQAVNAYPGIRILRQEPWEALCSFIISQNNNIPRIKGIIGRLCNTFGEKLENGEYSFPTAEKLAVLEEDDLAVIRAGFRNKYILDAARMVAGGEIDFDVINEGDTAAGLTELLKIKGVGPKVAMCTLLYGFGKYDAFPVDVWVKRIMAETYPDGLPSCVKGYEGIAQQYLFHYRRNK